MSKGINFDKNLLDLKRLICLTMFSNGLWVYDIVIKICFKSWNYFKNIILFLIGCIFRYRPILLYLIQYNYEYKSYSRSWMM